MFVDNSNSLLTLDGVILVFTIITRSSHARIRTATGTKYTVVSKIIFKKCGWQDSAY